MILNGLGTMHSIYASFDKISEIFATRGLILLGIKHIFSIFCIKQMLTWPKILKSQGFLVEMSHIAYIFTKFFKSWFPHKEIENRPFL